MNAMTSTTALPCAFRCVRPSRWQTQRGFTLIEILIATLLVGVGLSAVIGTVFISIQRAQESSRWAMSGPIAQSAFDFAIGNGLITELNPSPTVTFPRTNFETPWAMSIDATMPPTYTPPQDGSGPVGRLKTYRVRLFDTTQDRDDQLRVRATYLMTAYLRKKP